MDTRMALYARGAKAVWYTRNVGKCLGLDQGQMCLYRDCIISKPAVLMSLDAHKNSVTNEMRSFPFCC